jgi:two-component system, NarL family, sensor histidine kinase UhpB
MRDRAGRASRVQGIAIDVTERVRADQEVKASREQLRQLTCRVEAAREAERSRLSREIHDRVGQMLALLRMQVSDWRQRGATDGSPPTPEDLATMDARLTDAIETVRHIAAELRPQVLDDLGLAAAVTWQARHFNETGPVRFACEVDIAEGEWPPGAATDFFRIFQEASMNALQHAHARQVVVRLRRTRREFVMEVEDDGRGIPHGKARSPDSLGLLGMRERAARAGGRVTIRRRVNATGTIVRATCPIPKKGS